MRRGEFEAAWRETDRIEGPRREAQARAGCVRGPNELLWNGSAFEGRNVLVRCEHGLGDTLQFVRYLPRIRAVARSVTLLAQTPLVPLLAATPELGEVHDGGSGATPPHDCEAEIMELAYAFRSTCESIPRDVPYLSLEPLRALGSRLPELPRDDGVLRVGLAWSASDWDQTRSVPLDALEPFRALPDVRFYSLQQDRAAAEYARAPFPLVPYSVHTREVALAAAAMLQLDLVIAVDSMVAHLAGALARPVWVLLKAHADWRWMDDREDSPWYPTMRLFRQPREGEWSPVIARVANELAATVRATAGLRR